MRTSAQGPDGFRIGSLSFDLGSGDLTGPIGTDRLAPQPAALLALLASRVDEVVTRDQVVEHLWPGGKVEFEQGIAFALREIRKAVEAVGGDPGVVETIPKRGLRLLGPVHGGMGTNEPPTAHAAPASSTPPPSHAEPRRARLLPGSALLVSSAVVAAAWLAGVFRGGPDGGPAVPVLAVVRHDSSADGMSAAVASTLATELTVALTERFDGRLGVVGPTGTAVLEGPNDTETAVRELGACLILSGGVEALGPDSVIVFTQIVRASDRVHLWAEVDTLAAEGVGPRATAAILEGTEVALRGC